MRESLIGRYGCAVLSIALATWVRLLLDPLLNDRSPFPTLLFAVLLTAWFGGARPAFAAVALGVLSADYFLIQPRGTFEFKSVAENIDLILYAASSAGVAALGGIMQAAPLARLRKLQETERQILVLNRQLEEVAADAEAANRAKSTFLSTMSHEIRTPLNAILGYAQLMARDNGLGAETKANLRIVERSGQHLLALINDILDMSRIEAGRSELHPATFNLPAMLDDLAAMFRLRAEAKALRFEMLADGEPVPYVIADEGKIRQTLINLLGNAIKFTERGKVRLTVILGERGDAGLWLEACVEDTGSGMTEDDQQKLFQPFNQTARGRNTQEGTGLGLAISRQHARLMGGDITVSSSAGRGSVFRLEIPIRRGDAGVALRYSSPRRVAAIRPGSDPPRILVADDRPENRDWLIKLLTAIGFSARGSVNGEEAVKDWLEWKPGLILMDVHMPVMDGLEATRRIKSHPLGKQTAIIALTASAMEDDRRIVSHSGADDFLAKPCREDELLEKMRFHLNIAYDYEEENDDKDLPAAGRRSKELRALPAQTVEELRTATLSGNKRRLDELIGQLREADEESAGALALLAESYDYDGLTKLLEKAVSRQ